MIDKDGAKIATKLGLLEYILPRVNSLLIGGGMAAMFLKSQGYGVGALAVENDMLDHALKLGEKARSLGVRLLLPFDLLVAQKLDVGSIAHMVSIDHVPEGWVIADIGLKTIETFTKELNGCKTVFWEGPLECSRFPSLRREYAAWPGSSVILRLLR
ncbi:MAG: phosphoglycerate kinase [Dehalococcoidia bacterium]